MKSRSGPAGTVREQFFLWPATLMLAPTSHGTFVVKEFSASWYRCWPFATLLFLSFVSPVLVFRHRSH